jgi:hypothetical protein
VEQEKRGGKQCSGHIIVDSLLLSVKVYGLGGGGGGTGIRHNGIPMRALTLCPAVLQQNVKPLQLFFSFCLNLKFVPLFSMSVAFCAAAVCMPIAIVPVSAAVIDCC